MSIDNAIAGASGAVASERARRVNIIGPVRPLGPKAATLHARRQRRACAHAAMKAKARQHGHDAVLTSDDGSVAFALKASRFGLYVQRTQRRPLDAHVIQAMVFDSNEAFVRWCESDPIRFDHPVLYSQLRRHGDEALCTKR